VARTLGPTEPNPRINLLALSGLDTQHGPAAAAAAVAASVSAAVTGGETKLYVGDIPTYLTEAQVGAHKGCWFIILLLDCAKLYSSPYLL
jgi:hypothetical protein